MSEAILIGVLLIPVILCYLLRVNAVYAYFSLCLGEILETFIGPQSVLKNLTKYSSYTVQYGTNKDISIALIVAPFVITLILMFHTIKKRALVPNILPSFAAGLIGLYFVSPLISVTSAISKNKLWPYLIKYRIEIIGASAAVVLLFMAINRPKLKTKEHK